MVEAERGYRYVQARLSEGQVVEVRAHESQARGKPSLGSSKERKGQVGGYQLNRWEPLGEMEGVVLRPQPISARTRGAVPAAARPAIVAAASAPWIFAACSALVRLASLSLLAYSSRLRVGSVNGEVVSGLTSRPPGA